MYDKYKWIQTKMAIFKTILLVGLFCLATAKVELTTDELNAAVDESVSNWNREPDLTDPYYMDLQIRQQEPRTYKGIDVGNGLIASVSLTNWTLTGINRSVRRDGDVEFNGTVWPNQVGVDYFVTGWIRMVPKFNGHGIISVAGQTVTVPVTGTADMSLKYQLTLLKHDQSGVREGTAHIVPFMPLDKKVNSGSKLTFGQQSTFSQHIVDKVEQAIADTFTRRFSFPSLHLRRHLRTGINTHFELLTGLFGRRRN